MNIEYPINVKEAAKFLGVSKSKVYREVERKEIPHFRVMGRRIQLLMSDLVAYRETFRRR